MDKKVKNDSEVIDMDQTVESSDEIAEDNINKEAGKSAEAEFMDKLEKQLVSLTSQLNDAKRREQLALADYQNLLRRTAQERSKFARLAARNFVDDLLQPLGHLTLASQQLNDTGLNMVITQLWQSLEQNGLKRIDALGKNFDVNTMEVTSKGKNGKKVIKVVSDGYTLNDEIIKHAKVILD